MTFIRQQVEAHKILLAVSFISGRTIRTATLKKKKKNQLISNKRLLLLLLFSHSVASDSFTTPWTIACQAALSIGFLRQECWEWVAISFFKGSFQCRDWICAPSIAGGFFFLFQIFYLFILLHQLFVVAHGIFSCGMWDLVPWPGIEPRPPALGVQTLSHWTTREAPNELLDKAYKNKSSHIS